MRTSVRIAVFFVVAVVHFAVSIIFFFRSFAYSMDRMDTGLPLTTSERLVSFVSDVLFFPLVTLAGYLPNFLGPLADISFVLNSLLWSAVICWLGGALLRRFRDRSGTRTS